MPPYLLLSFLLGAIYGALFHLWQGQSWYEFAMYLLTGVVGVSFGQLLGMWLGLNWFVMGSFHTMEATIICLICLITAKWVRIRVDTPTKT